MLLLACVCVCERERLLNARVSSHLDNTPEYMPSVSADDEAADERAHVLAPADEEDKHGFYMFGVAGTVCNCCAPGRIGQYRPCLRSQSSCAW